MEMTLDIGLVFLRKFRDRDEDLESFLPNLAGDDVGVGEMTRKRLWGYENQRKKFIEAHF